MRKMVWSVESEVELVDLFENFWDALDCAIGCAYDELCSRPDLRNDFFADCIRNNDPFTEKWTEKNLSAYLRKTIKYPCNCAPCGWFITQRTVW